MTIDTDYEAKMGLGPYTENQGKTMLGSEAIIASLEAEGVDTVFGYPGGAALKIYDALYDSKKMQLMKLMDMLVPLVRPALSLLPVVRVLPTR